MFSYQTMGIFVSIVRVIKKKLYTGKYLIINFE
jgi:hypothetical protein